MDTTSQARENRERENRDYVRKLLRERQPDFAVVLESAVQEPCCPACLVLGRGEAGGERHRFGEFSAGQGPPRQHRP